MIHQSRQLDEMKYLHDGQGGPCQNVAWCELRKMALEMRLIATSPINVQIQDCLIIFLRLDNGSEDRMA